MNYLLCKLADRICTYLLRRGHLSEYWLIGSEHKAEWKMYKNKSTLTVYIDEGEAV